MLIYRLHRFLIDEIYHLIFLIKIDIKFSQNTSFNDNINVNVIISIKDKRNTIHYYKTPQYI